MSDLPTPSSPAPDLTRDVHLSKAYRPRKRRERRRNRREGLRALVPVLRMPTFFSIGVVITLSTLLATFLARVLGIMPLPTIIAGIVVAILSWIWFQSTRALPKVPVGVKYTIANEVDDAYRLRMTAIDRQAHAVLGTPLSDEHFEPRIFPIPLTLPTPAWPAFTAYIVMTIVGGIAWTFLRPQIFSGSQRFITGPWDYWAIMCLGLLPFAWTWPTYLRITPGRLEVLRYKFLGTGTPTLTSFDLRSARILIDLGAGSVKIGDDDTAAHIVLPDYGPRWTDIARALLEAARYQGEHTENLPKDALVG